MLQTTEDQKGGEPEDRATGMEKEANAKAACFWDGPEMSQAHLQWCGSSGWE